MLIVLSGKTASGKDTILASLLDKYPSFKKIITSTSRPPRQDEVEGKDYYFLTRADFEAKLENQEFIEHVEYGGNLYGTYKTELQNNLDSDLIWRIDPSRAGQVRECIQNSFPPQIAAQLIEKILVIYITTDDQTILQRLNRRGLAPDEIARRRQDDTQFWQQFKDNYDFVIENIPGNLQSAVDKICEVINSKK